MLQQRVFWCAAGHDPEGIHFSEMEYVAGIQRYIEVEADDPTRIVGGYFKAWWHGGSNLAEIPSYASDPYEYLEVHRAQVSNIFLVLYLLSFMVWLDPIHLARYLAGPICCG